MLELRHSRFEFCLPRHVQHREKDEPAVVDLMVLLVGQVVLRDEVFGDNLGFCFHDLLAEVDLFASQVSRMKLAIVCAE